MSGLHYHLMLSWLWLQLFEFFAIVLTKCTLGIKQIIHMDLEIIFT